MTAESRSDSNAPAGRALTGDDVYTIRLRYRSEDLDAE